MNRGMHDFSNGTGSRHLAVPMPHSCASNRSGKHAGHDAADPCDKKNGPRTYTDNTEQIGDNRSYLWPQANIGSKWYGRGRPYLPLFELLIAIRRPQGLEGAEKSGAALRIGRA